MHRLVPAAGTYSGFCLAVLLALPLHAAATQPKIVVPRDYSTIQAAIDAAPAGATVEILPGEYVEQLLVSRDLTLRGRSAQGVFLRSPSALLPYGNSTRDGRPLAAVVRIGQAARVRISRLTISGPTPCGPSVVGVVIGEESSLRLSESRVTRVRPEDPGCAEDDARGIGVYIGQPGSNGHAVLDHVLVDRYFGDGIVANGGTDPERSTLTLTNSVVRGGADPFLPVWQTGVVVAAGVRASIVNNLIGFNLCTVDFCGRDLDEEAQATSVFLDSPTASTPIEVRGNWLAGDDVGFWQAGATDCCEVRGNIITSRLYGAIFADGTGRARGNTIVGGEVGIGVIAREADTTVSLQSNRILGTTVERVRTIECCGYVALVQ